MFSVNTKALDYIHRLALRVLNAYGDELIREIFQNINFDSVVYPRSLTQKSSNNFDVFVALQYLDKSIVSVRRSLWDFEPAEHVEILNSELIKKRSDFYIQRILTSDNIVEKVFYFTHMAYLFLGGTKANYDDIDTTSIENVFLQLKPIIISNKLHKEYKSQYTTKSIEFYDIDSVVNKLEPVDVTAIPSYLIEGNENLIEVLGYFYFKEDVDRAIQQSLENKDVV